MALQCGIIGLPNVGKSTLFSALTNIQNVAANYEFATIEANIGIVNVPDSRIDILVNLVNPKSIVPTTVQFLDIAGLVKGASTGGGKGNAFLKDVREASALIHVIRCFEDDNIVRSSGAVDPVGDKEIIETELQLKDLESVEKKLLKVERAAKSGDAEAKTDLQILKAYQAHLSEGKNARTLPFSDADRQSVADLFLLTIKPIMYVANVKEEHLHEDNQHVKNLKAVIEKEGDQLVKICAALEAQIAEITDKEEKQMFLGEYGLKESGLDQMIRAAYHLLDLITYFTAGVQEVRAWTIRKGWKAPMAASVIHSDLEKGFIRAEVIKLDDYQKYKTENACKEAGKMALEGKDYIVNDADVIYFRTNK